MDSPPTRTLADLTLDDLETAAVWRIEDRDGVEMVTPLAIDDVPSDTPDLLIVRTRFRLANAATFLGFSAPGDWPGAEFVEPVIIHGGRHLPRADEEGSAVAYWATLAATPEQVFPVTAKPEVTVDGARVSRRYARDGRDPDEKRPSFWRKVKDLLGGLGDGF